MGTETGGSAGLLRDGKGSTWEGGMRVPGIFWMPGKIKPTVERNVASTLDLFPTVIRLAGGTMPSDRPMDGVDLSGLLFKGEPIERDLFCYYRGEQLYAARLGAWKLHLCFIIWKSTRPRITRSPPNIPTSSPASRPPSRSIAPP
jgi:arylsulfatase A-like enzyme